MQDIDAVAYIMTRRAAWADVSLRGCFLATGCGAPSH